MQGKSPMQDALQGQERVLIRAPQELELEKNVKLKINGGGGGVGNTKGES